MGSTLGDPPLGTNPLEGGAGPWAQAALVGVVTPGLFRTMPLCMESSGMFRWCLPAGVSSSSR
jgi:hypothetical protein